ncbi:MAG TPA: prepilin-type N-terminal cleavage/methylation domain-containing protein, partial [Terriglobales bacterium]|nr:prepilin-type N-terminal cleavage/methylation domain-containing protein [Terriglobales bacterium]
MTISQNCGPKSQQGFGLLELLVSIAIALLVIGAATRVFMQSMQSTAFVMQRNEMQTELRAAANQVIRDLQQAGTGVPIGGIPIPQNGVAGGSNPVFGADSTLTYLSSNTTLTQGRLYKVTPARSASSVGPLRSPTTSDAIVITYADPNLNWSTFSTTTLASDGSTLT